MRSDTFSLKTLDFVLIMSVHNPMSNHEIPYVPFRHISPWLNSVIGFPDMPQVPIPTLPLTLSGEANILFPLTPDFLVDLALNDNHLFFSDSLSSSICLYRCCFFCFFFFK